jgi:polar amino acid transport system substrate-binding protein
MRHLRFIGGLAAAIFAMLGCAALLCSAGAATLDEIKASGHMVVATEDDFRPFEFVEDGKPTGFDNEMLALFRKTVPFEVQQQIIPWTGLLPGVTTGKYDVAVTAAIVTKERLKSLDFTMPIADATAYYVKRKGDDSIKSVADLNGKTVGIQAGSALLENLPQLQTLLDKTGGKIGKIVQYTSYPEAYQDLALKRTDYVVNTLINVTALVKSKPGVFEIGQAVELPSGPAWAVKKGNASVLALLNTFLMDQKKSGNLAKMQIKWFGQAFPDLPDNPEQFIH